MCAVHCAWGAVQLRALCQGVQFVRERDTDHHLFVVLVTVCLDSVLNDLNMHGGHSEEFSR
jgi:hypothetical protein